MSKPRSYKFVSQNGGIWRLSEQSYAKLYLTIGRGDEFNLDDYGTQIVDQSEGISELREKVLAFKEKCI